MRSLITILLLSLFSLGLAQSEKKPLSNDVFDSWNVLRSSTISPDGKWVSYEINQQLGDGVLHVQASDASSDMSIPRGSGIRFHPQNAFAAFMIKSPYESVRKAKLKKTKKDKMPKDSLGIWVNGQSELVKVGRVKSFKMASSREGVSSNWIAYQLEKALPPPKDTTKKDTTEKKACLLYTSSL